MKGTAVEAIPVVRTDPRIVRTRGLLRAALFELARERPLETITVADIADRAGVNRSTYYQHYSDKDALLAEGLDAWVEEALSKVDAHTGPADGRAIVHAYLAHIADNAALYRQVLSGVGSANAQAWLRERLARALADHLDPERSNLVDVPLEIAAAAISGAGLSIIRAWLEQDEPAPVDEAVSWIWAVLAAHGAIRDQDSPPPE